MGETKEYKRKKRNPAYRRCVVIYGLLIGAVTAFSFFPVRMDLLDLVPLNIIFAWLLLEAFFVGAAFVADVFAAAAYEGATLTLDENGITLKSGKHSNNIGLKMVDRLKIRYDGKNKALSVLLKAGKKGMYLYGFENMDEAAGLIESGTAPGIKAEKIRAWLPLGTGCFFPVIGLAGLLIAVASYLMASAGIISLFLPLCLIIAGAVWLAVPDYGAVRGKRGNMPVYIVIIGAVLFVLNIGNIDFKPMSVSAKNDAFITAVDNSYYCLESYGVNGFKCRITTDLMGYVKSSLKKNHHLTDDRLKFIDGIWFEASFTPGNGVNIEAMSMDSTGSKKGDDELAASVYQIKAMAAKAINMWAGMSMNRIFVPGRAYSIKNGKDGSEVRCAVKGSEADVTMDKSYRISRMVYFPGAAGELVISPELEPTEKGYLVKSFSYKMKGRTYFINLKYSDVDGFYMPDTAELKGSFSGLAAGAVNAVNFKFSEYELSKVPAGF